MVLVMDIGNTNIVLGVFSGEQLVKKWRITTDRQKTADEYGILIEQLFQHDGLELREIKAIVISSVVPPIMPTIERMCKSFFKIKPLIINSGIKIGIEMKVDDPRQIGADRIVNAVAAYELYGGPVLIIDLGTATTCCAVSRDGKFLGGVIVPGIGISTQALFLAAAKLPRVEIIKPERAIGNSTVMSMQSGIYYGYVGMVDGLIERFWEELGEKTFVVATGGFAELIAQDSKYINEVNPALTLEGLRILYERNR